MNKTKLNGLGKVPKGWTRNSYYWYLNDQTEWIKEEKKMYRAGQVELKKVRTLVKQKKYDDIVSYMKYCEANGVVIKIVKSDDVPDVEPQEENYSFKEAYIEQSCGYCGDDYYGDIWVHLKKDKYLKFSYAM